MRTEIPYGITDPDQKGLTYLGCEISYGGQWVDLNDGQVFKINGQNTLESTQKTWRKITTTSPILGGDYLIHATPDMVNENVSVWIYGNSQSDLSDNFFFLEQLFEQFDFRIRWTFNEYREYWRCQLAEANSSRGQVWAHNQMAMSSFTVPRFPDVTRERI